MADRSRQATAPVSPPTADFRCLNPSEDRPCVECDSRPMATYFAILCRVCGDTIHCDADELVAHVEIATFTAAHANCGTDIELRLEIPVPVDRP